MSQIYPICTCRRVLVLTAAAVACGAVQATSSICFGSLAPGEASRFHVSPLVHDSRSSATSLSLRVDGSRSTPKPALVFEIPLRTRLRGGSQDAAYDQSQCVGQGDQQAYAAGEDAAGAIALHDGWYQYWDEEQGLPYYYNVVTGVTEWELPGPSLTDHPPPAPVDLAEDMAPTMVDPYSHGPPAEPTTTVLSIPVQSKKTVQTEGKTGMPKQSSSLKLAGLDIMDSTHAGILKSYMGGLLSDGVSAIVNSVADVTSKFADISGNSRQPVSALERNMDGCSVVREEWQVAQGLNEKNGLYTTFRHRKYGTVIELYEDSQGSFNFVVSDEALPEVCRCMAITEFVIEKRDYLFHPMLTDQLRRDSDNDAHSMLRYPQIPGGNWFAESAHEGVLISHKGKYDKNNVAIFLIPDGFIFVSRGNINNLDHYRTRQALIVRQGFCYEVEIQDARQLILQTLGPILDLTHFGEGNGTVPNSYEHLLEEGERIQGHDRSLEERWLWKGGQFKVVWADRFADCVIKREEHLGPPPHVDKQPPTANVTHPPQPPHHDPAPPPPPPTAAGQPPPSGGGDGGLVAQVSELL